MVSTHLFEEAHGHGGSLNSTFTFTHSSRTSESPMPTPESRSFERLNGQPSRTAAEGIVPLGWAVQTHPEKLLGDDPELGSAVLGQTTGSTEPATEDGIDPERGDSADATQDAGPELPEGTEPDLKNAAAARTWCRCSGSRSRCRCWPVFAPF